MCYKCENNFENLYEANVILLLFDSAEIVAVHINLHNFSRFLWYKVGWKNAKNDQREHPGSCYNLWVSEPKFIELLSDRTLLTEANEGRYQRRYITWLKCYNELLSIFNTTILHLNAITKRKHVSILDFIVKHK